MTTLLAKFRTSETGATAIEYALIAGFISLLIVVSVASIGSNLTDFFTFVGTELEP